MAKPEYFLSVNNLKFKYIKNAKENNIDLECLNIQQGKTTVIIGSSGSGKSTLAMLCAHLLPDEEHQEFSGEIFLCNKNIKELTIQKRTEYLSAMFQNPDLQFCMDTLQNEMYFCLENMCVNPENMDSIIEQTCKLTGTNHLLSRKLSYLSGGEKQLAALTCLLCINSKGILLDEPFANLDHASTEKMLDLLKQLKENGTLQNIIAIDHRIDYWLDVADEFIILGEKGKLIARNINRENLQNYKSIFENEGLFFPKEYAFIKKPHIVIETAIELVNFTLCNKSTNEFLLQNANAKFAKGKITAIIGASGCGKTSLFSAVLGQKPFSGTLLINGINAKKLKGKKRFSLIGTVFQNPANQFTSTQVLQEIITNIKFYNRGLTPVQCQEKALQLLEEYGLLKYQKYSPYMLSQGQQRRLAVLSVLCGHQQILLIDEPTYGQDYKSTKAIMEHFLSLSNSENLTIIFTTHHKQLAFEYAHNVYEYKEGSLKNWNE